MNDAEQEQLAELHRILYKFEQNCHKYRIDAISEKQLVTKLATEKALVATAIMALVQPAPLAPLPATPIKNTRCTD